MTEILNANPEVDEAVDYPVCEGCGEKHPPLTAAENYQYALGLVAAEAAKVAKEHGDEFPELAEAVKVAENLALEVLVEQILGGNADALKALLGARAAQAAPAPAPKKAPVEDVGYGLYL